MPQPPAATFDKKNYRANKYGNRGKLQSWRRDEAESAARELRRITGGKVRRRPIESRDARQGRRQRPSVQAIAQKRSDEKAAAEEIAEEAKRQKAAAAAEYARKKADKFKKLSKRSKRGQPLMKDRMEMLLEEIQKSS